MYLKTMPSERSQTQGYTLREPTHPQFKVRRPLVCVESGHPREEGEATLGDANVLSWAGWWAPQVYTPKCMTNFCTPRSCAFHSTSVRPPQTPGGEQVNK